MMSDTGPQFTDEDKAFLAAGEKITRAHGEGNWTVQSTYSRVTDRRGDHVKVSSSLLFRGEVVHTGESEHTRRNFLAQAQEWNDSGYAPEKTKIEKCRGDGKACKSMKGQMGFIFKEVIGGPKKK